MAFFSFRAECPIDVQLFQSACANASLTVLLTNYPDGEFPDVDVEMESAASLETLRDVMRGVEDGHVMLQTLRECCLEDNSLSRDYELE